MNIGRLIGSVSRTGHALGACALGVACALGGALVGQAGAQPAAPANGPRWTDPGWHALTHATLIPEPGRIVDDATVVIRNGRIESVEAGGAAPEGARVWDCSGLHIYAGLVESYLPVDAPKPDRTKPGAHWNSMVTPERSALDGDGVSKDGREKLRKQGFTVAMIAPKDGIFQGSGAVVALGEQKRDGEKPANVLSPMVFQVVSFSTGRGGSGEYPGSKMGSIALIRQTMADVAWYVQSSGAYRVAPDKNPRPAKSDAIEAMLTQAPVAFDVSDELDALRAAKIAAEFGRPAIIVGSGTEFRRLNAIVKLGLPLIVPLAYPEKPKVESPAERAGVGLRELMTWEAAPSNAARLIDAGVRVAITSSKLPKDQKFFENLRLAIAAGLTKDQALAALTTTPAQMLGLERVIGKVEPGMAANLIVVDDELFEKDREIRDVWIDGERYEINPTPPFELEGQWAVEFTVGGAPIAGVLKIDEENAISFERPATDADRQREAAAKAKKEAEAGKAGEGAKADAAKDEGAKKDEKAEPKKNDDKRTFKARSVSTTENRLSFLLDGDAVGVEGVVMLSAIVEDSLHGSGALPDGAAVAWSATRQPKEEDADDDEEEDDGIDPARFAGIPESFGYPFGPFAFDAPPEQPESMLVRNARIWTSGRAGIIEKGEMEIRNGKIAYVGEDKGGRAPRGAVVIDAGGRNITPGLIDCHSHTGISGGVNESRQAVTAEVRIGDVINPDAIGWYRELAGGLTAVNQLHGSANPIGGQNSVVKIRWGVEHPDDMKIADAIGGMKFALGENVKQSNWESDRSRYPQTRMGVETLIVDRFTAAREYGAQWKHWKSLDAAARGAAVQPRRDLELEALAEILDGTRLVHCHSYRQDEILMLCRVSEQFDFTIGTFQHVLEGYKVADAIRERALGGSSFSDWWAYKFEVIDAIPGNGALMHDVGVNVSFNSDSDELARRMNVEAAKAVRYGNLAPEEALKFVTLNPAEQLKIDAHVGSLEVGKDADFVIWSADPLSVYARCEATYIDGREYFSLEKDAQLRAAAESERQRIIQKLLAQPKKDKGKGKGKGKDGAAPEPGKGGELTEEPPPDVLLALTSGRGRMLTPIGAEDIERARERAFLRALEHRFEWLTLNGVDLSSMRCADCGASLDSMLMQN